MVLQQGLALIVAGLVVGFWRLMALRAFCRLAFWIRANDPLTFLAVCGLVVTVGVLACYIPARRATRVDPLVALRYE